MVSMPSRFLKVITPSLAQRARTARAKAEGRASMGVGGRSLDRDDGWGRSSWSNSRSGGGTGSGARRSVGPYGSAAGYGGAGFGSAGSAHPSASRSAPPEPEDESQDAPMVRPGERVRHARFGTGTIAELTGSGRDMKVRIDFDDAEIGRKTLVLAQAKLERGWD